MISGFSIIRKYDFDLKANKFNLRMPWSKPVSKVKQIRLNDQGALKAVGTASCRIESSHPLLEEEMEARIASLAFESFPAPKQTSLIPRGSTLGLELSLASPTQPPCPGLSLLATKNDRSVSFVLPGALSDSTQCSLEAIGHVSPDAFELMPDNAVESDCARANESLEIITSHPSLLPVADLEVVRNTPSKNVAQVPQAGSIPLTEATRERVIGVSETICSTVDPALLPKIEQERAVKIDPVRVLNVSSVTLLHGDRNPEGLSEDTSQVLAVKRETGAGTGSAVLALVEEGQPVTGGEVGSPQALRSQPDSNIMRARVQDVVISDSETALKRLVEVNNHHHFDGDLIPIKFLGRGVYGAVYHVQYPVRDGQMNRSVDSIKNMALKIFFKRDEQAKASLSREIKLLSRLEHSSIIRVDQYCADCCYFLMPISSDMNLHSAALNGLLSKTVTKRVVAQLAFILEYLKLKGVAHFDFKPENMAFNLNDEDFPVTLLDFGLAEDASKSRMFSVPRGPVGHRSPEMYLYWIDGRSKYDPFIAHWFSLGVTLCKIAYLKVPYVRYCLNDKETEQRKKFTVSLEDDDARQYFASSGHFIKAPSSAALDLELEDLLRKLTDPNPATRAGFDAVRHHPWLSEVNWPKLESAFEEVVRARKLDA